MLTTSTREQVNGITLRVHRFRDPSVAASGTTALMLHGYMDAGATWDLVAGPLTRAGHAVIAPDLRGFGESDRVGAGGYYHFPDYVADVAELVEREAPERLVVVGHSMGGTVACLYAGAVPKRVARLALLEGVGPASTEPTFAVDKFRAWLKGLSELDRAPKAIASIEEGVRRLAMNHPRVDKELLRTRAERLSRVDDEGRLVWAYDPLHRTTSPMPFHAAVFEAFLAKIECPTLFIGGGPLGWHPPEEDARLSRLRDVLRVDLPEAGHMMHWTTPDEVATLLLDHFRA